MMIPPSSESTAASIAESSAASLPASTAHTLSDEAVLRGTGTGVVKSAALSPESSQPPPFRSAAFVDDSAAVAAAPSNWLAVPYPTRSTQPPTVHGVKVEPHAFSLLDVRTRATLPFDALMSVVPEASSVGNATPLTPPANLMRKYWPGWRLKLGRSTARPALLLTKLLAVAAY